MTENTNTSLVYVGAPDQERLRTSDGQPYPVYRYTFEYPEIHETVDYVSEQEATSLRPSDPSELPQLQVVLLADYLTDPEATWLDVSDLKRDASDSFYITEGKERAENNTAFTPQVALELLARDQSDPGGSADESGVRKPSPGVGAPSMNSMRDEPASSTPWIMVGLLATVMVAAIAVVHSLLRRPK